MTERALHPPIPLKALKPLLARLAVAVLVPGCLQYPQRLPGPLVLPEAEAERQASEPRTSSATVQRDSSPVWVRRPGERGYHSLPFYRKRERLPIGAQVRTGAGGRAELFWSPDATSLLLFDEGRVTLGDPQRDEPLIRFQSVTHALLVLTPEDRVELLGGALLQGDPGESTALVLLEEEPAQILRVTNQSKKLVSILFRAEALELGPGESIDLPVLGAGSHPRENEAEPERVVARGIPLAFSGRFERVEDPSGVSLCAQEPSWVRALGVTARLEGQRTARFSGLSQVPPATPADAGAKP